MKHLIHNLKNISDNYGVIAIKQSFEDEGVSLDDLIAVRRLTDLAGIKSFVKIGGCEAKSDVANCIKFGVDSIIAPMIESKFALTKFIDMVKPNKDKIKSYIIIETKQAYFHLEEILDKCKENIDGIIIGRSDFTKSFDKPKDQTDSDEIYSIIQNILTQCKKYDIPTTMGGNISVKSVNFIKNMYGQGLLNKIETRNVVIELRDNTITNLDDCIKHALSFEIEWLKYKYNISTMLSKDYLTRINILENRC